MRAILAALAALTATAVAQYTEPTHYRLHCIDDCLEIVDGYTEVHSWGEDGTEPVLTGWKSDPIPRGGAKTILLKAYLWYNRSTENNFFLPENAFLVAHVTMVVPQTGAPQIFYGASYQEAFETLSEGVIEYEVEACLEWDAGTLTGVMNEYWPAPWNNNDKSLTLEGEWSFVAEPEPITEE